MLIICPSCGKWIDVDITPEQCPRCTAQFITRFPSGEQKIYSLGIISIIFFLLLYMTFPIILSVLLRNHSGAFGIDWLIVPLLWASWTTMIPSSLIYKKYGERVPRIYYKDQNIMQIVRPLKDSIIFLIRIFFLLQFVCLVLMSDVISNRREPAWYTVYPFVMNTYYFALAVINILFGYRLQLDFIHCRIFKMTHHILGKPESKRVAMYNRAKICAVEIGIVGLAFLITGLFME